MTKNYLIVGAGFAGCIAARELAEAGNQVHILDKRDHIAGNAYDKYDRNGVLIHEYGPHIFHTNSERIFKYLSKFTKWRKYEHRVLASVNKQLLPIPINRTTINKLYDLNLTEEEVLQYLEDVRIKIDPIETSEDVVLNSVGNDLCDKFFRGYTKKQWGLDLSELSAGVASRIPTRTNDDDRYFTDKYQAMPLYGYTKMFENILSHPNIKISLSVDFFKERNNLSYDHLIYTGPIDQYFNYQYGVLPYRSIRFQHKHFLHNDKYQQTGTINYPNEHDFTRITEFKYLTGQEIEGTSIVKEFPCNDGDPYYPIPRKENDILFKKYQKLALNECNTSFVGRLAQYKYYNMDQVVAASLKLAKALTGNEK